MPTAAYNNWVRNGRPWKVAAPIKAIGDRLRAYGYVVYYLGSDDRAHLQAAKPQDHCPFSFTGWPVAHPYPWVTAMDIMPPKAGSGLPSLQRLGAQMIADRQAGHPGMAWLKYINHEPDRDNGGACWHHSWQPNYARVSSNDRGHIHASGRSDMVTAAGAAADYDPVARIRGGSSAPTSTPTQGDDMSDQASQIIEAWAVGRDKTSGGATVEPVKWRVRDETFQAQVMAAIKALNDRPTGVVTMRPEDRSALVNDLLAGLQAGLASSLTKSPDFLAAVANAVADVHAERQKD